MINNTAFIITILAPEGKLKIYDPITPMITANTDTMADIIIVDLKLLDICKAVTVGNTIMLDISMVPTTLIPSTIVMAVSVAIR